MICITTALIWEAKPIIEFYSMKLYHESPPFKVYRGEDIVLVVSGTGKVNAATATAHVLTLLDNLDDWAVVNIGICGTRSKNLPIGMPLLINRVIDNGTGREFFPDILLDHSMKEGNIMTYDRVIDEDADVPHDTQLLDMEAAGFFEGAAHFLPPHRIQAIKVVSDYADASIGIIDRHFIEKCIGDAMPYIDIFLTNLNTFLKTTLGNGLDHNDMVKLERIRSHLHLTSTQYYQLKDMAYRYKLMNKRDLPDFQNIMDMEIKVKQEGKRAFDMIKAVLLDE